MDSLDFRWRQEEYDKQLETADVVNFTLSPFLPVPWLSRKWKLLMENLGVEIWVGLLLRFHLEPPDLGTSFQNTLDLKWLISSWIFFRNMENLHEEPSESHQQ